ncbi:MAG: response regulator transcription factor [Acidobacteriota bacterium]|nr:response regulator transcription factor [Acidobacteriota bacterium]
MTRVLIVEDDDDIAALIREQLDFEGFDTTRVNSGAKALATLATGAPDLVVLDLGLPDQNGFEVCKTMRERHIDSPILVLTARDETVDKVRALDLGADDYLTKPFELAELLARVRALLRRGGSEKTSSEVLRVGGVEIDQRKRRVRKDGKDIELTAREFDLLCFLATRPGDVVSRDHFLEHLWPGIYVSARTIDVHIAALRKKLEADPKTPTLIVGVRGVGYRLDAGAG